MLEKLSYIIAIVLAHLLVKMTANAQMPDIRILPEQLKIRYEAHESEDSFECKAAFKYEGNPYDFGVKCFDQDGKPKGTYDVHLAISIHTRTVAPKTMIEVLYWVNGEGATTWLTFADGNRMTRYHASQSIKNDNASLTLELDLPMPRK